MVRENWSLVTVCVFNLVDLLLTFAFTHLIFPPHSPLGSFGVHWDPHHCLLASFLGAVTGDALADSGCPWVLTPGASLSSSMTREHSARRGSGSASVSFLHVITACCPSQKCPSNPQINDCSQSVCWKAVAEVPVSGSSEPRSSFCPDHTLSWLLSSLP